MMEILFLFWAANPLYVILRFIYVIIIDVFSHLRDITKMTRERDIIIK